ncbi:MAG TPA: hypothetical protein VK780_06965 [Thermoanaerobaculia bacterium]|nr:hypothetical protein [Thermoanaerobaculia bacterium]
MASIRWRRAAASYLLLFFLAVAAAPHHHLNDLEDLLLDQRSDSGILVQTIDSADGNTTPEFHPARVVHDVSCLACFTRDFVCATTDSFLLVAILTPLPLVPTLPATATPALVPADASSRAPPRIS